MGRNSDSLAVRMSGQYEESIMSSIVIGTLYGQMSFMCLLILGVICFRFLKADDKTYSSRQFLAVGMLTAAAVVVDYIIAIIVYGLWAPEKLVLDTFTVIYFILIALLSYHWFLYCEAEQQSVFIRLKSGRIVRIAAQAAICIMMITVMYLKWTSFRNEMITEAVIAFIPAIYSCIRAFYKSFLPENYVNRDKYRRMASFAVLPVIMLFIQYFTPMLPSFVCGVTLGYMLVYSNGQKSLISTDLLTGINNRSAFDKYISAKVRVGSGHSQLYLYVIDVDDLKSINKEYGPLEGDKVLVATAFALKALAAEYDFYIARFDADEFAVAFDTTSGNMMQLIRKRIEERVPETAQNMQLEAPVTVTIGVAKYTGQSMPAWIAEAHMALENARTLKEGKGRSENELQKELFDATDMLLSEAEVRHESSDELDLDGLDEKLFPVLSEASQRIYMFVTNMETNVTRWSKNAFGFMGIDSEYDLNTEDRWKSKIHPDDIMMYQKEVDAVHSGKKDAFNLTYRVRDEDGVFVSCTGHGRIIKGVDGSPDIFAGSILNHGISDSVDSVTNLWNMKMLGSCLNDYIFRYESAAVLIIGITKYGHINDTYGYELGNEVLKNYGDELLKLVTGDLHVFRMDGTKFAFIKPYAEPDELSELYLKVKKVAEAGVKLGDGMVQLRLAGGAVTAKNYSGTPYNLLNSATYALSISKHEKHGDLVFFDSTIIHDNMKNMEQIAEIHKSVMDGCKGFFLCYQPIVSATDGRIVGAEALIRWKNEKYGFVPPDSFIPWLEEDPCIYILGNWIIETALVAAKRFKKVIPDFFINVNIAATQLENTAFRTDVLNMVERLDFPKEDLWIELTERCKDLDHDFLKREISFFKEHGIQIALDDYGTGSASLSLALELPVGEIKIDRSFTKDVMEDELKQAIVESILVFTGRIRMRSCIEGIETHEMAEYLKQFGPMYYQGYAYSKPVEEEAFMSLIKEQSGK